MTHSHAHAVPYKLLAAALLLLSGQGHAAGSTSQNFNVTASVVSACSIATINDLAFGTYSPTLGNSTSQTSASVTCSLGTTYYMTVNQGNNYSGGRRMSDGSGHYLNYDVTTDPTRLTSWPNSGTTVSGLGTGLAIATPIYGSLPASQGNTAPPGSYTDVLQFTVSW